ncbi:MAG: helix-turn-helix transcriptional regulator [Verrucomicrobiae bacterium]|nr:helix-turn-helix transcriptional regulator [Verrucomicrobiae bacterium]
MSSRREPSAIFEGPSATYHADRCEPLVQAVARGEVRLSALAHRGYPGRALPATVLPEVSTVGCWDAPGTQRWGLDWHRNEGIEFTFVSRGRTAFLVEGRRYPLGPGHLTITRPWQKHRVGDPHIGPSRLLWLILDVGVRRPDQPWHWPEWLMLDPDEARRLTTLLRHNENPVWRADREVGACFESLARLADADTPRVPQSRIRIAISELALAILDLLERERIPLDGRLVSVRRTVDLFLQSLPEHLDHPWTLEAMAARCGLGRSRFSEYCRQLVNMTPGHYLTFLRIEEARRLLTLDPERGILDIALACGFQTSQYFATAFRKATGLSPRAFADARQRELAI